MSGKPFTMEEAAKEHFRCCRRKFQGILSAVEAAYPDVSFYTPAGRDKLFFPEDIARIHEARRWVLQSEKEKAPKTIRSGARSQASMWKRAQELLTSAPPKLSPQNANTKSSKVVSLGAVKAQHS